MVYVCIIYHKYILIIFIILQNICILYINHINTIYDLPPCSMSLRGACFFRPPWSHGFSLFTLRCRSEYHDLQLGDQCMSLGFLKNSNSLKDSFFCDCYKEPFKI